MHQTFRCTTCKRLFPLSDILTAQNPFATEETVTGCPNCKDVNTLEGVCDEPECTNVATCGFPTDAGGYRRTCFRHSIYNQEV